MGYREIRQDWTAAAHVGRLVDRGAVRVHDRFQMSLPPVVSTRESPRVGMLGIVLPYLDINADYQVAITTAGGIVAVMT
jgi:hypothetical protein